MSLKRLTNEHGHHTNMSGWDVSRRGQSAMRKTAAKHIDCLGMRLTTADRLPTIHTYYARSRSSTILRATWYSSSISSTTFRRPVSTFDHRHPGVLYIYVATRINSSDTLRAGQQRRVCCPKDSTASASCCSFTAAVESAAAEAVFFRSREKPPTSLLSFLCGCPQPDPRPLAGGETQLVARSFAAGG